MITAAIPPDDDDFFDPTLPSLLRTQSGSENPSHDYCEYFSGCLHPTLNDLRDLTAEAEAGSMLLPATIPLVNQTPQNPLRREPVYGVNLVWNTLDRSKHLLVMGLTGAGKNTTIIDLLRFSCILDPAQSVVTFSLKASDYAPIKAACDQSGKRLVVINLADASRSSAWNALATDNLEIAVKAIELFADRVRNPLSNDSEFWTQCVVTAITGAWKDGYRSFHEIYTLFNLPRPELIRELESHANENSRQISDFLKGGSHNADTVHASIVGALKCFLSEEVRLATSRDEVEFDHLFEKPVCVLVEMPEPSLDRLRPLHSMLACTITDSLVETAERLPFPVPTTVFYDDRASLGNIDNPERLFTLRSRAIGIVAGVQSMSALRLAYGEHTDAVVDAFHTKIILPGCPTGDAEFFSRASGEQMIALPCYEGQNPSLVMRPLISPSDIRCPRYSHNLLGRPATIIFGAMTFQAYLQRSYELPAVRRLLKASWAFSGRAPLRACELALPTTFENATRPSHVTSDGISDSRGWSQKQVEEKLASVESDIGWGATEGSARTWWSAFVKENKSRLPTVLRLAEELLARKATIAEFFLAHVYSNTDNIQANLSYLDYVRLKKQEEDKKRQELHASAFEPPARSSAVGKRQEFEQSNEKRRFISAKSANGVAVYLDSCRIERFLEVVNAVKEITGVTLSEAKALVETAPIRISISATKRDALAAMRHIRNAGGEAHVE